MKRAATLFAQRRWLPVGLAGLLGAGLFSAQAQDSAVQRCQRIAEPGARLVCYDTAFPPLPAAADAPRPAAAAPAQPAVAAAPAAAPAPAPAPAPSNFGLSSPTAEAQAIESSVGADFDGWSAKSRIRLANGQVWQIADDSNGFLRRGPHKVTVRRGALGAFYMDFEGSNHRPRVRRIE